MEVFKTLDSERSCFTLASGSIVYCDRRFFAGGELWLHCVANPLFDNNDARPEDSACRADA